MSNDKSYMDKKVIQLTESEFNAFIQEATKQVVRQFDGKISPNDSSKRTSSQTGLECNADQLNTNCHDNAVHDDKICQYKDIVFMFLGTNRTKVDEPFTFQISSIDKLDENSCVFKGIATWDGKRFLASVRYGFSKGQCFCTNKRMGLNNYALEPVPPTKQAWDSLISLLGDEGRDSK